MVQRCKKQRDRIEKLYYKQSSKTGVPCGTFDP